MDDNKNINSFNGLFEINEINNINDIDNSKALNDLLCEFENKDLNCEYIPNNYNDYNEYNNLNNFFYSNDLNFSQTINYDLNYTVKQLLLICDYYGLNKVIKTNRCNKETIINILLDFENNLENTDVVYKRKKLWHYINELKNDKFMKKFIIWDGTK